MDWILLESKDCGILYDSQLLGNQAAEYIMWYRNEGVRSIMVEHLLSYIDISQLAIQRGDRIIPLGSVEFVSGIFSFMHKDFEIHDNFHPDLKDFFIRTKYGKSKISELPEYPIFIKPSKHNKLFDGQLITKDSDMEFIRQVSKQNGIEISEDMEVYYSEPVEFIAEYRSIITPGNVLSLALYINDRGDELTAYKAYYDAYKTAESMANHLKVLGKDRNYNMVVDIGLTSTGVIDIIECANHILTSTVYNTSIDREKYYSAIRYAGFTVD